MINYDYLDWGVGVASEDNFKKIGYEELDQRHFFETEKEDYVYDEKSEETNEYNVWYMQPSDKKPWGEGNGAREAVRQNIREEIAEFLKTMGPGNEGWEFRGGRFLDAFLMEDIGDPSGTGYENVLLLACNDEFCQPIAVIWERVPEEKRTILMNLQKRGEKLFAVVSDRFRCPGEDIVCLEVYMK